MLEAGPCCASAAAALKATTNPRLRQKIWAAWKNWQAANEDILECHAYTVEEVCAGVGAVACKAIDSCTGLNTQKSACCATLLQEYKEAGQYRQARCARAAGKQFTACPDFKNMK
jgi:hypothetical protein